jgi:hypothetical protein
MPRYWCLVGQGHLWLHPFQLSNHNYFVTSHTTLKFTWNSIFK